jgi:hypothetical protein
MQATTSQTRLFLRWLDGLSVTDCKSLLSNQKDRREFLTAAMEAFENDEGREAIDLWCRGLCRKGIVEPLVWLMWGPLLTEQELLAGKRGLYLEDWQLDAIRSYNDPTISRVGISGNTGCGKNAVAGMAIATYYYSRPTSKQILTREPVAQAKLKTWAEVDKWMRRSRVRLPGQLLKSGIQENSQHYVITANPASDEAFSGAHTEGGQVAFLFDEATSIPLSRWDMADTQAETLMVIFNPRTLSGPTREMFPKGRAGNSTGTYRAAAGLVRHISVSGEHADGFPVANIRLRRLRRAIGPVGGIEIKGRRFEHGEEIPTEYYKHAKPLVPGQTCYDEWLGLQDNPRTKQVFAFGYFPDEDADFQVVLASWVDAAVSRWRRWHKALRRAKGEPRPGDQKWSAPVRRRRHIVERLLDLAPIQAVGLDVAGSDDGDESTLAIGGWYGCRELHAFQSEDLTEVADWADDTLIAAGAKKSDVVIGVDADGIGHGVADMLKKKGWKVAKLRGGDPVLDKRWQNSRCERVGRIGERMNPSGAHAKEFFMLPDDPKLTEELLAYEKFGTNKDATVMEVTPKRGLPVKISVKGTTKVIEPIVQQLGRSPDSADAVGYMFSVAKRRRLRMSHWV